MTAVAGLMVPGKDCIVSYERVSSGQATPYHAVH